ncbi:MAG TPA: transcription elongation factor GreA [Marinilabiliales bacterium]|nr:MAG: transcription elongation factor GreA [Bacteroidetes bacterium GWA2_40_14]OFX73262.1 MAG: transcription elongation factor GreA [Bacteroidetes bacterium GWD2_40_43]OFX92117.1 MAG: transcription elongation factor GreA [Bacteroidetes bacterium GWE2_40_63]OFY24313.1 MAG: transcription elongation factor GreA [Bacteroidetes bacterium GWF2_40_13]OFZ30635.1 MAG: transcription elongation factor GreA [Bacteroidetes bacterium RIFOXYC2_FULL_40_12]HAM98961.1 transcription elongation factor GreA [Mar
MGKLSYITNEGLKKLIAEVEYLKTYERPKMSAAIAEARDKGDLSENAEYDAAKEAQGLLELKISQLEETILNSRVIDESKLDYSCVQILSKVKIKNLNTNAIMEYAIVSETEADLKNGRMSINTPIAMGLMGKKIGAVVEVKVPSGLMKFEILEINPI